MNNVVLIGRLVRDPEISQINSTTRTSVAKFTLAIDKGLTKEKKQEFENQGKNTADFIRIVVWGKQGEACANYLSKGKLVAVQGSIQSSSYKSNSGETRYSTDVIANKVEFLEWGEKKPARKSTNEPQDDFSDYELMEDDDDVPF